MHDSLSRLRTSLADRYEIERELGRGGMATVYLARDLKLERHVALKVLMEELGVALGPERFRREIALATQLTHPHILPIYDSGEAGGQLYYVMPYVSGESLRDRLDTQRQLPVDEALRITCEIASALEHAHQRGIVHRDIKPENILLEGGQALVADFGIARALSAVGEQKLTKTGVSLGTPAYMSPEQAMADPSLDARSDIYSLGCVLYEMLAGTPPFTGPTAQAVIARHALAEVPSLTVARGTVPDEVEDAVLRAMAKVPADRFATASEFASALHACRATGTAGTRRLERRTRARSHVVAASRGRLTGVAAVIALMLVGAGWFAWPVIGSSRVERSVTGNVYGSDATRLAVLYFDDPSPGGELDYLAEGLTESLIEQLGGVSGLDVVSRNGVAPFRGKRPPRDSLMQALDVGTLIEGFVEHDGDAVRVTMSLADGSGEIFSRVSIRQPKDSALTLRTAVADSAALLLRTRLREELQWRKLRAGTSDPEAWALVQRAEKRRKDAEARESSGDLAAAAGELDAADTLLAGAMARDPRWVEPLILRGQVAGRRERLAHDDPRAATRALDVALAWADSALAVEPRNPDALELRATLHMRRLGRRLVTDQREIDRITAAAEKDLLSAVSSNPRQATALYLLSRLMYQKLDIPGSNSYARRAYEADAFLRAAPEILYRLYVTYYDLESFGPAKEWCDTGRRRFPIDPNFARCDLWLMTAKGTPADVDAAWNGVRQLVALTPPQAQEWVRREGEIVAAAVLARAQLPDSARRVLERARADRTVDPTGELIGYEAFVRTQLGDHDTAIALLQRYLTDHPDHRRGFAKVNAWWWRDLQNDPRFKQMIAVE